MKLLAKFALIPSISWEGLFQRLLHFSHPLIELEVQRTIKKVTTGAVDLEKLNGEERTKILEIIDKAAPCVLATKADREFVDKLGKICSAVSQLPNSIGFLENLQKHGEIAFASGGSTDTWRGEWKNVEGAVSIKAFRTHVALGEVKKLVWERAPIWKRLKHENVLPFYGVDTSLFALALVYEWGQKENIVKYLKSNPNLPGLRAKLLLQVAKGLQYLHSLDVIHGKLKGNNVLISEFGTAQVCDYGLSPIVNHSVLSETKTPGAVRHFQWNAPEIIGPPKGSKSGPLTESKPADVFAFAMLAVEVYTGELPFGDIPNEQAVLKIFNRERPSKPAAEELTEDMWKFVKRCWGQRPKKRPTIDEVVRIWEGFVNSTPVSTTRDGEHSEPPQPDGEGIWDLSFLFPASP